MKKMEPSPAQRAAIETRDRTLLVSAAAGSGKTSTLTKRIIASLLDSKNPESLQNMLIVTFTNASVADLVRKIGKALTSAVNDNPENGDLERELYLLPSAKIRTIDAFCGDILRQNADRVGVPPNYRIAEKAEISLLTGTTLDTLISLALEGELRDEGIDPADFALLTDALTGTKNESACAGVIESLYEKSKNLVDGVDAFDKLANNYLQNEKPLDEISFVKDIMEYARETIKYCTDTLLTFSSELKDGDEYEARDAAAYRHAADILSTLPTDTYASARAALLGYKHPPKPSCREENKTPDMCAFRDRYEVIGSLLSSLKVDFFSYDETMWRALLSDLHKAIRTLCRFLHVFDKAYVGEKIRRGMLEYSDIERFCYKCLYNEDGSYTDVALAYQRALSSIYIDEYQDVNELQDAIFRALSNGKNRFMVGDIKQSIYVFRSAKPEIFRDMKDSFPTLSATTPPGEGNTIFMSENFRCDESVVDFVNSIFDVLFNAARDSIGYIPSDRLRFAKVYPEGIDPPKRRLMDIYLLDREDGDEATSRSAEFTADKIAELLESDTLVGNKPISPSDIAILMCTRTHFADYAAALKARGIPVDEEDDKSYFKRAEVQLALCLLYSIDNPERDVYLAGLMCSPLYSFTADDMLTYRLECPARTLYKSLVAYRAAHPECAKLAAFLDTLDRYRTLSEGIRTDALILRLYRETGLLALGTANGGRDNLMMLYNLARKYEASSYRGLYSFICHVRSIQVIGEGINEKNPTGSTGAVRLTTSHSSKGLEFPIVFFADASRPFNFQDLSETVAYHDGYGAALYLRDGESGVICENPIKKIINEKKRMSLLEEELRVLYVSLTRACERVYVVADLPKNTDYNEYLDDVRIRCNVTGPFSLRRARSLIEWILAARPEAKIHHVELPEKSEVALVEAPDNPTEARSITPAATDDALYNELLDRFSFKYPDEHKTRFPEKISVSRLYPRVLDGADEGEKKLYEPKRPSRRRPEFITGVAADLSAKAGISTHLVLQFCELERLERVGAAEELRLLGEAGFISESDAALVRVDELTLFLSSKLLQQMKGAKSLYREFRFSASLPSRYFTEKEPRREALLGMDVLVQGVMDCVIIDNDGEIHLVDYKTDRLTAAELADRAKATATLNDSHAVQLTYYALAIERIFGKLPKTVSVYSLPLGDCVPITPLYLK